MAGKGNRAGTEKAADGGGLFPEFGEFDSAEEINRAAEGLLKEGDMDGLRRLAEENGLEWEDAKAYADGGTDGLCDVVTAAVGKLQQEKKAGREFACLANDVAGYLMANCSDEGFARQVRKKGKRIEKAAERILREAEKNRGEIGGRRFAYCGPMRGYQLIREYYMETEGEDSEES